jgi:hypothetical protein
MIDRNKSTRRGRRVLTINSATIVRISEVTIPNRARVAGRIRNEGMLTLGSSTVSGNGTAITGVGRVAAGYSPPWHTITKFLFPLFSKTLATFRSLTSIRRSVVISIGARNLSRSSDPLSTRKLHLRDSKVGVEIWFPSKFHVGAWRISSRTRAASSASLFLGTEFDSITDPRIGRDGNLYALSATGPRTRLYGRRAREIWL